MRPRWQAKRGQTLLEVTVASAVLALLTTMVTTVIIAVSKFYQRTLCSYELNQNALSALTYLARDLEGSRPGLVNAADPSALVFVRSTFDPGTATTMWDRYVCYFSGSSSDGGAALLRVEERFSPLPVASPPSLDPSKNKAYFVASTLQRMVVASDLDLFQVSTSAPHTTPTVPPVTWYSVPVQLRLQRYISHRYSVKVTLDVPLRN